MSIPVGIFAKYTKIWYNVLTMEHALQATPVIGETFQSLYDPNGHLSGPFMLLGRRSLMQHLLKKRVARIALPGPDGLEMLGGRELMAAELAHSMLIADGNYTQAEQLSLSENRLLEAVQIAHFGAQKIVVGVHAAAQLLLENNPELAELTAERDPRQHLVHGVVLAAAAHRGEVRASGWPYVYHPIDCATISGIAARKEGDVFTDDERYVLRLKQFVDLLHDTWENSMESKGKERGSSFLTPREGRVVASPLVQYLLLQSLDVSDAHSFIAARSNFMLTKTVGPEKSGRMDYGPYAKRLYRGEWLPGHVLHLDTPMAVATKLVDLHHNGKIDPKRVEAIDANHAKERKQRMMIKNQQNNYGKVFRVGERRIAQSDADPMVQRIARNVRHVTPKDLDDVLGSARILDLLRDCELILDAVDACM